MNQNLISVNLNVILNILNTNYKIKSQVYPKNSKIPQQNFEIKKKRILRIFFLIYN